MPTETLQDVHTAAGGPGAPPLSGEGGDDGRGTVLGDPTRFGLWLFLATLSMMFIGFTSAYMVRRASPDWRGMPAIPLLWVNTVVLLASSGTLEAARRKLRGFDLRGTERWLLATGALGAAFLGGQVLAWRTLAARGFFLAANPHNSFFYLMTGVHLVHIVAALVWFVATYVRVRRMAYAPGEDGLGLLATFWHFLGALWLYLLVLLFAW
jgi:cytochrome c oxidase subunit III